MATSSIQHVFLTNLTFIGTRSFWISECLLYWQACECVYKTVLGNIEMYIHDNVYVMITVTMTWHCCAKVKGEKTTKMWLNHWGSMPGHCHYVYIWRAQTHSRLTHQTLHGFATWCLNMFATCNAQVKRSLSFLCLFQPCLLQVMYYNISIPDSFMPIPTVGFVPNINMQERPTNISVSHCMHMAMQQQQPSWT